MRGPADQPVKRAAAGIGVATGVTVAGVGPAAVSIGVPLVTYVTFERWFLVPLPKGPIEDWLGL